MEHKDHRADHVPRNLTNHLSARAMSIALSSGQDPTENLCFQEVLSIYKTRKELTQKAFLYGFHCYTKCMKVAGTTWSWFMMFSFPVIPNELSGTPEVPCWMLCELSSGGAGHHQDLRANRQSKVNPYKRKHEKGNMKRIMCQSRYAVMFQNEIRADR